MLLPLKNTTQLFPVLSVSLVSFILLKKQSSLLTHFCENYSNSLTTICLTRNILKATFKHGVEMSDNLAAWDLFCIFLHLLQPVWWFLAIKFNRTYNHVSKFLVAARASLDFRMQKLSTEQITHVLRTDNSCVFPPTSPFLKILVQPYLAPFMPKHFLN